MKKNIFFWFFLFFCLTTYNITDNNQKKFNLFQIKYIEIEGIKNSNKSDLIKELSKIKKENLIFLKSNNFERIVKNTDFVNSIKIKKIYPDRIKVTVIENAPIGIYINEKGKKYYLLENNKIVDERNYKIKNLPQVSGKGGVNKFSNFHKSLKKTDFNFNLIKEFIYHDIGRWDILLHSKKLLKLPPDNFENSIVKFLQIYEKDNFKEFKIFDFRIKNELILK